MRVVSFLLIFRSVVSLSYSNWYFDNHQGPPGGPSHGHCSYPQKIWPLIAIFRLTKPLTMTESWYCKSAKSFRFYQNLMVRRIKKLKQWKPLDVITDNVIIPLMWSHWPRLIKSQIPSKVLFMSKRFIYCYHLVNVLIYTLSQNDRIKRLPPYFQSLVPNTVQWTVLNGITLSQTITDPINWIITKT